MKLVIFWIMLCGLVSWFYISEQGGEPKAAAPDTLWREYTTEYGSAVVLK